MSERQSSKVTVGVKGMLVTSLKPCLPFLEELCTFVIFLVLNFYLNLLDATSSRSRGS
jgi:hypothetical protein